MTPGDIIRKKLEDRGWTQSDLAKILDRPLPTINEIITGKKAITPETALGLGQAFGDDAGEWMRAEAAYRLSLVNGVDAAVAERARLFEIAPIKDMQRRGWIPKTSSSEELEQQLRRFFDVDSLKDDPQLGVSRRTSLNAEENVTPSQRAWCFRARNMATAVKVKPFTNKRFESGINKLKKLTAWPEGVKKVPSVLADMGIRFVVVEPLPKTRIDGAAFRLDEKSPVIALSVRYDRVDSFWHTLGHELSHIRHNDDVDVDVDLVGDNRLSPVEQSDVERRADSESSAMWINQKELEDFIVRITPLYSRARINQFANRLQTHPGIIVGQLQFRGELGYGSNRDALVKVREHVVSTALTDGWGHSLPS